MKKVELITNHKIRILHLTPNLGIGGAARTIQSFIKFRNKQLFEEAVCCLGNDGPRAKTIKDLGAEVFIANSSLDKARKAIGEYHPNIIHLHYDGRGNQDLYSLLKFARSNRITTVGTNIFAYHDQKIDILLNQQLFKSKMMLAIKFKKNTKKETLPFSKYKVIYNPVDTESFCKYILSKQEIMEKKKKLGIPGDVPVIGRVGRADIVKWGDLLLEAIPYLLKVIPNCKIIIRGLPNSRLTWVKKAEWASNVILLDETNNDREVMETYQLMDVYTHTTKIGEAFGNTLNEAMYFKKPIVTHSTPHCDNGQIEQVEHGKNGLIANIPETFAKAVIYLLQNQKVRREMGNLGHNKVITEYNPRLTTHRLEKVYLSLIARKRSLGARHRKWLVGIDYFPSERDLRNYDRIYIESLNNNFYPVNRTERVKDLLRFPIRFYRRAIDFYYYYRGV